jgi:hypothetical protein
MLEAHHLGAVRPGVRAVYDHYSRVVSYDATALWNGDVPGYDSRFHSLAETQEWVAKSIDSYVDCHVWLFTPDSFVEQLNELRLIGRSEWYVDMIRSTQTNQIEFMVRLRRLARGADSRSPVTDELVPTLTRPDWLQDPGRVRRIENLEREAKVLRDRVTKRSGLVRRLRRKVAQQQALIARQQAELDALRQSMPVRASHLARTSARKVAARLRPRG